MNNYAAKRSHIIALEIHVILAKFLGTSLCSSAKQVALKFAMCLLSKDFNLSHVQHFLNVSPRCILAVKNANSLLGAVGTVSAQSEGTDPSPLTSTAETTAGVLNPV